jgi:hypothetical protein
MYLIDTEQLKFLHPHLRAVLRWISARFGMVFVITGLYRIPVLGQPLGVHNVIPLRGTDLRCHSVSVGMEIKRETNAHWKYDPQRPHKKVVRCHGPEIKKPLHIHVQTHPRTFEV